MDKKAPTLLLTALVGSTYIAETAFVMRADLLEGIPQATELNYALAMPSSASSSIETLAFGPGLR